MVKTDDSGEVMLPLAARMQWEQGRGRARARGAGRGAGAGAAALHHRAGCPPWAAPANGVPGLVSPARPLPSLPPAARARVQARHVVPRVTWACCSLPTHAQVQGLLGACGAQPGDLLLLAAGPHAVVARALDRVRQFLAREVLGLVPAAGAAAGGAGHAQGQAQGQGQQQHSLLWVTDFPMFEFDEEQKRCGRQRGRSAWPARQGTLLHVLHHPAVFSRQGVPATHCSAHTHAPPHAHVRARCRFVAMHHPFTAPHPEDLNRPDDTAALWRAQVGALLAARAPPARVVQACAVMRVPVCGAT